MQSIQISIIYKSTYETYLARIYFAYESHQQFLQTTTEYNCLIEHFFYKGEKIRIENGNNDNNNNIAY